MIPRNLTMISSEGEQWGRYNLPRTYEEGVEYKHGSLQNVGPRFLNQ